MSMRTEWPPEHLLNWTPRQRDVLKLIGAGRTNAEIAEALGVTLPGAKWHVSEVLTKLGVASREEAADYWRERSGPVARARRSLHGLAGVLSGKVLIGGVTAAGVVLGGIAIVSAWRGSEVDPSPAAPSGVAAIDTPVATPPIYRAALGGRLVALGAHELFVEDGEGQHRVVTTAESLVTKAEGAPVFQLVTGTGLARLRIGDTVDVAGVWIGTDVIRGDTICANCWLHRPAIVASIASSTLGLRIQQGPGTTFPDSATEVHIDPRLVTWPQPSLTIGERVQFEAAQADDGSLVLVALTPN